MEDSARRGRRDFVKRKDKWVAKRSFPLRPSIFIRRGSRLPIHTRFVELFVGNFFFFDFGAFANAKIVYSVRLSMYKSIGYTKPPSCFKETIEQWSEEDASILLQELYSQ